jgi:hypothetical protein
VTMCEHGAPSPTRCALCRLQADMLENPDHYARKTQREDQPRGVPRPAWFDSMVEAHRPRKTT